VSLLVDTSVWSLAFRRDAEDTSQAVDVLRRALDGAEQVFTTGLVLQELLQGFAGPKARGQLIERFAALAFLQPDREDHINAAEVRNTCRKNGVQIGTIDALLIQLCLRHDLVLLSKDNDFRSASRHVKFRMWSVSDRADG
jgi:predicted nucleic acid-binding protein